MTDIYDYAFETRKNHIENFKIIVNIMKKNNIDKISVTKWDDDGECHWITGTEKELEPFLKYREF